MEILSEVNNPNDEKWKELQRQSLAKCARGDHTIGIGDKCLICGHSKKEIDKE